MEKGEKGLNSECDLCGKNFQVEESGWARQSAQDRM